ncbi:MAG: sulfatase [Pirellulales bacterium]|nr:sulfatase [Pirellulales bacterium]
MIRVLLCMMLLLQLGIFARADDRAPNILFVMIDDMGWMDLACQGNKLVETPHVDRLAKQGVRFTSAYAAAPVCSPTRAAIMTGKSPARLHITNHIPDQKRFIPKNATLLPAKMHNHLALEEVTIAERLKEAGYATAFMGKWHLSGRSVGRDQGAGEVKYQPEHQGFDINIGGCALGGPPSFFDPYGIHNLKNRRKTEYLPDRLADEAISFIQSKRDQPFALFLWNYTVHWPMQAPQELLDKYADRKGPGLRDTRYGAMLEAMDASMGRIFAELDRLKLTDSTLVVFTSDNGGFGGVADNRPLRGDKGHLYEGGIRVPLIVRWPGVTKAGTTCDEPVISMDWYPTLLAAAGEEPRSEEGIDGADITPLLRGAALDRDAIYFHYPNYAFHRSNRLGGAIRSGQYKLIERFDDGSLELYDLESDLSEKTNLAKTKPEIAEKLQKKLAKWRGDTKAAMPIRKPL